MSTRGAVGFIKNGHLTTIYNSGGSSPEGLGNDILDFIRRYDLEEINKLVDSFVLADEEGKLTESFYSLREFWKKEKKETLVYDSTVFLYDSLMCEWAYIINLDTKELELYKGMNEEKPIGRFSNVPKHSDGHYSVSLIRTIPLHDLPPELDSNWR